MLDLIVTIHLLVARWATSARGLRRTAANNRTDRGQATAEYALVLLGATALALLLAAWAAKSGKVTALLDAVIDKVIDQV